MQNQIYSLDSPKAIKARKYGYVNAIHYMAPHTIAGVGNLCPWSTGPCRELCLGTTSGQAGMVKDIDSDKPQGNNVRQSRIDKARRFMRERNAYMADMVRATELAKRAARKQRKRLACRPNGSTDIAWEGVACERNGERYRNLMDAFPELPFVDYTKNPKRFDRRLPANYFLTFSYSGENLADCLQLLARKHNVAVIFAGDKPTTWHGYRVVDGDQHDLRHLDPKGVVVGLSPKGNKAKKSTSAFVVR
jgi:hypothetical protein